MGLIRVTIDYELKLRLDHQHITSEVFTTVELALQSLLPLYRIDCVMQAYLRHSLL